MSGVVPASATEVFRNERRERSRRVMAKTVCMVNGTLGVSGMSGREVVFVALTEGIVQIHRQWQDHFAICGFKIQFRRENAGK
jgi:hypothetical protein